MKKLGVYLIYSVLALFVVMMVRANLMVKKTLQDTSPENNEKAVTVDQTKPAEKVQVYVFHSTNRCYSCVTMGQYIKATVEEYFQPELQSGKLEFKEINVDLPENKEVAKKFQAAGTSLFINAIIDGQDNIEEETQAWRLLGNQKSFSDYFYDKIRSIIGETVSVQTQKEMEEKCNTNKKDILGFFEQKLS